MAKKQFTKLEKPWVSQDSGTKYQEEQKSIEKNTHPTKTSLTKTALSKTTPLNSAQTPGTNAQTLLTHAQIEAFQHKIFTFYKENAREMAWRSDPSPYAVFVSEIMLQQTQVSRVAKFFPEFCKQYPNFRSLSEARLDELLLLWKGMGYTRRAMYLRSAAQEIVQKHKGELPAAPQTLQTLPGIGPNTAGSIAAFAYNAPVVFIETNIRRVYIHEFFSQSTEGIHDKLLMPYIEVTLPKNRARTWYQALMDYGVSLREAGRQAARKSKHYSIQAPYEGSRRQLRASILNTLAKHSYQEQNRRSTRELYISLKKELPAHPFTYDYLQAVLKQLESEELLVAEHSPNHSPEHSYFTINA